MIHAYDLDGVLAAPVPASFFIKPWRKMNGEERRAREGLLLQWYEDAPTLFQPEQEYFHVVTARKNTPVVQSVTLAWLRKRWGERIVSLHMLGKGRTVKNVVVFKTNALREIGATDFTEDNRTIVRALRKESLRCRIWHFTKGQQVLDYEPGFT